jgi:hypothetical protein
MCNKLHMQVTYYIFLADFRSTIILVRSSLP